MAPIRERDCAPDSTNDDNPSDEVKSPIKRALPTFLGAARGAANPRFLRFFTNEIRGLISELSTSGDTNWRHVS
jgi:hypothetical protein